MANNNTVKKKKVKMSTGDKVFTVINTVIMILVCIAIVYPLYYVLLASVTDPVVVSSGKILLYPEAWYTNGYETTLKYQPLWTGYANTIKYTVLGTLISLVCTIPAGYALSRYDMVGRKPIMFLFTFTMFFSGGMIPMYLTVQQLHIYNTTWAMVLPVAVSAYNLIVCRSFFESGIPVELLEAAKIDGASPLQTFFKITVPLLKPMILLTTITSTNGTLQLFDESLNLTNGGPGKSTMTMSHYIYNMSFVQSPNFGYAAAMSILILIMVAILVLIQMKVGDER